MKHLFWVLIPLLFINLFSCTNNSPSTVNTESTPVPTPPEATARKAPKLPVAPPPELEAAYQAHGGMERWKQMNKLVFVLEQGEKTEKHTIDLKTRKVFIINPEFMIGNDGKDVWITPNVGAFGGGSPRFYHNLNFYFFSIPFIFSDPGVNFEVLPEKEFNGKLYDVVKVTFDAEVGDAPKDEYIAHFDKKTHQLYLLLYTVTYRENQTSDSYNALVYEEWQEVNGFLLPKTMKGVRYADDKIGEERYVKRFSQIEISEEMPDNSTFEKPGRSEIDPLPKR